MSNFQDLLNDKVKFVQHHLYHVAQQPSTMYHPVAKPSDLENA